MAAIEVAEVLAVDAVTEQALQGRRERGGELARDGVVLVLILAQPALCIKHVDAEAGRVAAVLAAAVPQATSSAA